MHPRPFRDHNHAEGEAPQRPPFQNEPVRGAQQGGYGCKKILPSFGLILMRRFSMNIIGTARKSNTCTST